MSMVDYIKLRNLLNDGLKNIKNGVSSVVTEKLGEVKESLDNATGVLTGGGRGKMR